MANKIKRLKSIREYHDLAGLPKPEHPMISLIDYSQVNYQIADKEEFSWIQDFYSIALKRNIEVKLQYGQQRFDFDEGLMSFFSPGQVLKMTMTKTSNPKSSGWILMLHPDFIWKTALASKIDQYEFFSYSVSEALFLSEKEELVMAGIMENIRKEYHSNIDKFSQNIIISHVEVLLNYSERFYERQFITRKNSNHQILEKLNIILKQYFNREDLVNIGLPTVQFVAESLNVSPNYLSGLLKVLTGESTQQHIHNKLIEKAKEKLTTTNFSISEVAFQLGFEHSQSFSRLFKTKTNLSPLEFRESFN